MAILEVIKKKVIGYQIPKPDEEYTHVIYDAQDYRISEAEKNRLRNEVEKTKSDCKKELETKDFNVKRDIKVNFSTKENKNII